MPADLDNLFTDVARQADTILLGTAETARRRGRARRRNRAVVASAAAMVCLVTAGTAAVLTRRPDADPSPTQTMPLARRLPEAGPPFSFGGRVQPKMLFGADDYAAWQTDTRGPTTVAMVDPVDGSVGWRTSVDGVVEDVSQTNGDLLVRISSRTGFRLLVLDLMSGQVRWELPIDADDEIITGSDVVLRWSPTTGRTYGYDLIRKTQRWAVDATTDPPVGTVAMDRSRDTSHTDPLNLTFVQVTKAGKVQLRSSTTGALQRLASIPEPHDGQTLTAVDGRLYSDEIPCCDTASYRVRVTDLRTDRVTSNVVFSEGMGHRFGGMAVCATDRLCVLDHDREESTVAAIDLVRRKPLWRVPVPVDASAISSRTAGGPEHQPWVGQTLVAGGDETVLLNPDGQIGYRVRDAQVRWSTDNTVVALPRPNASAPGNVTLVDPQAGRPAVLGSVPANVGWCVANLNRMTCQTETGLRFYKLD